MSIMAYNRKIKNEALIHQKDCISKLGNRFTGHHHHLSLRVTSNLRPVVYSG